MRVLTLMAQRDKRRDDGAVAIIVSLFLIVFLIFAAFAVDIGNAYANKRQLSVAADAAALAAAKAVGESVPRGMDCEAALAAMGNATQIAKATADEINAKSNRKNAANATEPVDRAVVTCIDADGDGQKDAVEVQVDNSRDVQTAFASIIGVDQIATGATATAIFARFPTVGGLRPWAICDGTAKASIDQPDVTFFTGLDNKLGICSKGPQSGNWGSVDFDGSLGNNANSAKILAAWTLNGYAGPRVDIPGLIDADPGVSQSQMLEDAFKAITGEVVAFPAASECVGGCNGNTAKFDTLGVIFAKVCGVKYGNITFGPANSAKATDCWRDPATWLQSASARTVAGVSITKNTTTLTAATDSFSSADIGRNIVVVGAGSGNNDLTTVIKAVTDLKTVELQDKAGTTVASVNAQLPAMQTTAIPKTANGDFVDFIQFRWRDYTGSYSSGSEFEPCTFADARLCAGAVLLWR